MVSARRRGFLLVSASEGGKEDFRAGAEPSVQGWTRARRPPDRAEPRGMGWEQGVPAGKADGTHAHGRARRGRHVRACVCNAACELLGACVC